MSVPGRENALVRVSTTFPNALIPSRNRFGRWRAFTRAWFGVCYGVWLAKDAGGKLSIEKESNAGNPLTKGLTPILGFDVWEHSYYLDYQNRRADHLKEIWKIIDWETVSNRY